MTRRDCDTWPEVTHMIHLSAGGIPPCFVFLALEACCVTIGVELASHSLAHQCLAVKLRLCDNHKSHNQVLAQLYLRSGIFISTPLGQATWYGSVLAQMRQATACLTPLELQPAATSQKYLWKSVS